MALPIFADAVVKVRDELMAELTQQSKPYNCQLTNNLINDNCQLEVSNTNKGFGGKKKRKEDERIIQDWMKLFIANTEWADTPIGRGALRNLVKAYGSLRAIDAEVTRCGGQIEYSKQKGKPVTDEGPYLNWWLQQHKPITKGGLK